MPSKNEVSAPLKQIQIYGLLPTLEFQKVKCCATVIQFIDLKNKILKKYFIC